MKWETTNLERADSELLTNDVLLSFSCREYIHVIQFYVSTENTQGKYHWTAGLQYYWFEFYQQENQLLSEISGSDVLWLF